MLLVYFNPRAPYGARLSEVSLKSAVSLFQSTRPIRGATLRHQRRDRRGHHFNPRAPYGARRRGNYFISRLLSISIHAPHTGRDWPPFNRSPSANTHFNPRAPYGARPPPFPLRRCTGIFQSTRPIRGATSRKPPPRCTSSISIHAPHTGRDPRIFAMYATHSAFQSTRPIRGATPIEPLPQFVRAHFNPRAPYGARLGATYPRLLAKAFQSTRPIRGATCPEARFRVAVHTFQSTRPIRGATIPQITYIFRAKFQSTRPIRGATRHPKHHATTPPHFNPRAPYGARLACIRHC